MKTEPKITLARVEQIRRQNQMIIDGKLFIIRTHKNAAAVDLLSFIDDLLEQSKNAT